MDSKDSVFEDGSLVRAERDRARSARGMTSMRSSVSSTRSSSSSVEATDLMLTHNWGNSISNGKYVWTRGGGGREGGRQGEREREGRKEGRREGGSGIFECDLPEFTTSSQL